MMRLQVIVDTHTKYTIKNLKSKDEINFQIGYSVIPAVMDNLKNNKDFQFYIPNKLYKNDIRKNMYI